WAVLRFFTIHHPAPMAARPAATYIASFDDASSSLTVGISAAFFVGTGSGLGASLLATAGGPGLAIGFGAGFARGPAGARGRGSVGSGSLTVSPSAGSLRGKIR